MTERDPKLIDQRELGLDIRDINRPGKPQIIREFVNIELDRFKTGELSRISSDRDLMNLFGYSTPLPLRNTLKVGGLVLERDHIMMELTRRSLAPSVELAWMLGVLTVGGYVDHIKFKEITLYHQDQSLLGAFKTKGEKLFHCSPEETKKDRPDGTHYRFVRFRNRFAAQILGDLRETQWPETMVTKYNWISSKSDYIWGFLEGFFEIRGSIDPKHRHEITIIATLFSHASYIKSLLEQAGILTARFEKGKGRRDGIQGIVMSETGGIKKFVQNIHSVRETKESLLESYRSYQPARRYSRFVDPEKDTLLEEYEKTLRSGQIMSFEEFMDRKEGQAYG